MGKKITTKTSVASNEVDSSLSTFENCKVWLEATDVEENKTYATMAWTELNTIPTINASDVDTTKAGTYTVTYKVADSRGALSTKTITVNIKANDTQKPTIDYNREPVNTADKQITKNSLKTGDSTNIAMWLAIMSVSFGLLVNVLARKSRKNR